MRNPFTRFFILLLAVPGLALADGAIKFSDVTKQSNLALGHGQVRMHGASWADVDGDGDLDLYTLTFGKIPNQLFLQVAPGKFILSA